MERNGDQTMNEEQQGTVTLLKNIKKSEKTVYLESYGCAMNFSDSEIVASILDQEGFSTIDNSENADLILLNTCAIREKAEQTIRHRLVQFQQLKKKKPAVIVGLLGCMAERLKEKLLEEEKIVDLIVGPDAYRSLPSLIQKVKGGQKAVNVLLSREETYSDVNPIRLDANGVTAFVSIMRGCDNMCSFCVVPFTRGRERSRDFNSILQEVQDLWHQGYKEITLLGQNVDSYKFQKEGEEKVNFAQLLEKVAQVTPQMRIRFSTSHPKDMTDEVLEVMSKYVNICKYIHLPVQSGNSEILEKMNRGYSREWYLDRIAAIRKYMPECAISTDIITGFCSETEAQHQETLSLMGLVKYDFAYMFKYSERPNTLAERKYTDDVPEEIKARRLQEIIDLQRQHSLLSAQKEVGKIVEVLIEGISKKSEHQFYGRSDQNKTVVFEPKNYQKGDLVKVKILSCTSGTLIGELVD